MTRRLLILTCVLTVFGAACTNLPNAQVDLGSGQRFVPTVADAIDNVGLGGSVAVDANGNPFLSYFGFKGAIPAGAIPIPRPIGSPNVPGVFVTTEKDGLWTRGAAAMVGTGPAGLTIPFGPVEVKSADALTPTNTNGSQIVVDPSGGLHVVWTDGAGVWYADGTTSFTATNVLPAPLTLDEAGPIGWPSVAVDDSGTAWVAVAANDGDHQDVHVIQDPAGKAIDNVIAQLRVCNGCAEPQRTAIGVSSGAPVVAYVDTDHRSVVVATPDKGGWITQEVESNIDASGLSMTVDGNGRIDLVYYAGTAVHLASADAAGGSWSVTKVADSGTPPATGPAPTTGVSVDDKGTMYVTWFDATSDSVILKSSSDGKTFTPIATRDTHGGRSPDVAVAGDGSKVFLSWYDPVDQDMALGMYGNLGAMNLANPSPLPTVVAGGGGATCKPAGTKLTIDAPPGAATAGFSTKCLAVDAGTSFTITLNNNDPAGLHNFAVYTDASASTLLFDTGLPAAGPTVEGPKDVSPLKPGSYFFRCDIHTTTMTGTFIVAGK